MKSRFINFRQAADEVMEGINFTHELKEKVLGSRTRRRRVPVARLAAMAACGVLIFGVLNFSGVLRTGYQPGDQDMYGTQGNQGTQGVLEADDTQGVLSNPEAGIFSASTEQTGTSPEQHDLETGQPDESNLNEPSVVTDWLLNTSQEAGQSFGGAFLTPSYIPEGFKQDSIFASGSDAMIADRIILSYIAEERSLVIIEEKMPGGDTFLDHVAIDIYEAIDINGVEGFLKAELSGSEVNWFKDGVRYCVTGQITFEEALKVARSMK